MICPIVYSLLNVGVFEFNPNRFPLYEEADLLSNLHSQVNVGTSDSKLASDLDEFVVSEHVRQNISDDIHCI